MALIDSRPHVFLVSCPFPFFILNAETAAPVRALPAALDPAAAWAWLAVETQSFARRFDLPLRDVVVLLPFAQHLPLARAAWSRLGEALWLPRFETTQTLAASTAAPRSPDPGALSFDPVSDRLQAARLLAAGAPDWSRRDARGFELALARLVETAQSLARVRLALPPQARDAWLDDSRSRLAAGTGADAHERALARLALEWSTTADATATDGLHALAPAGWVALRAGASDPLATSLLAHSAAPVLWLDAGRSLGLPLADAVIHVTSCPDFEDEAQRSAAQVLEHLARGEQPVALVALDRVLVRRVRALLERQQVPIDDETGWKLSTTRAGASVAGLLRAARPRASTDELLDWLKSSGRDWPGLDALEAACRRGALSALHQLDAARLEPSAAAVWQAWLVLAEPLRATRRLSLAEWLGRLGTALKQAGVWETLLADAAGAQVLEALRLHGEPAPAWVQQAAGTRFDAAEFGRWAESVLEQIAFEPRGADAGGAAVAVVITPLSRAMLRPFAAVVCPGADEAHLGAAPAPQPLLGDALAQALGMAGSAERRAAEEGAFAQLLRAPKLALLHRRRDGNEPLQPSALLLRLQFAAERAGRPLRAAADPRELQGITARPVARPAPSAAALLPDTLNATAYEALRACPYRFFAERMLRLGEAEELDDALDKRDYGTWLHAVLQDFHRRRDSGEAALDSELLRRVADEQQVLLARDDADFLLYAAWFEQLAPRYLELLHREEAEGLHVRDTELALQAAPPALAHLNVTLRGQLDRVDRRGEGAQTRLRVVDYKTSGNAALRQRLKQPFEDTQLPFYAALIEAAEGLPPGGVEAAYLALDGREGVSLLPHAEVQASAASLLEGIASDYGRLRGGAALPALGEGKACEHCNARGLCRRDHWDETPADSAEGQ